MTKSKISSIVCFLSALLVAHLTQSSFVLGQQYDFFLSNRNLNEGAVNGDLSLTVSPGESISLYLYYSTNGPANSNISAGAFVDFQISNSSVANFTDSEAFDFDILFSSSMQDSGTNRWTDANGQNGLLCPGENSGDMIDEMCALSVFGPGIVEANNGSGQFLDAGYDPAADAFLFGRVDLTVTGDEGQSFFVFVSPGIGGIADGPNPVNPEFGFAFFDIASFLLGDINGDDSVDLLDVGPFVDLLTTGGFQPEADINEDGMVDLLDVTPFVQLLTGG